MRQEVHLGVERGKKAMASKREIARRLMERSKIEV